MTDDDPITHPLDDQGVEIWFLQPNVKIGRRVEGVQETMGLQDALHGYLHGISAHGYARIGLLAVSRFSPNSKAPVGITTGALHLNSA